MSALERHLEVSSTRRGEDDPNVIAAYEDVADAFEEYDAALYEAYGEMTPLDIYGADEDDEDDDDLGGGAIDAHDDEDGDDRHGYAGLDDDDVVYDDEDDRP